MKTCTFPNFNTRLPAWSGQTELDGTALPMAMALSGKMPGRKTWGTLHTSQVKWPTIGKIAEGTTLTRRTVTPYWLELKNLFICIFKTESEEFIPISNTPNKRTKHMDIFPDVRQLAISLVATWIFTAEKGGRFCQSVPGRKTWLHIYRRNCWKKRRAPLCRKIWTVLMKSVSCQPKGFVPTQLGTTPRMGVTFYEGTVKHIYFIAETKGTMESLNRPMSRPK